MITKALLWLNVQFIIFIKTYFKTVSNTDDVPSTIALLHSKFYMLRCLVSLPVGHHMVFRICMHSQSSQITTSYIPDQLHGPYINLHHIIIVTMHIRQHRCPQTAFKIYSVDYIFIRLGTNRYFRRHEKLRKWKTRKKCSTKSCLK